MKSSKLLAILVLTLYMGVCTSAYAQESPGNYAANQGAIADGQSNSGTAGEDNVSIQITGSTGKVKVRVKAHEVEAISASSSTEEFSWPWEE